MRLRSFAGRLRRRRRAIACAGFLSILLAILLVYRVSILPPSLDTRRYQVSTATVLAMVDTAQSQVVDLVGTAGADTKVLSDRANILAALATSSPMTLAIAARAGVPAPLVVGVPQKRLGRPIDEGPQVLGAAVTADDRRALVIRAHVPILAEGATPIIEITTQAPDRQTAARLAAATIGALKARILDVARAQSVPPARSVTLRQLSSPRYGVVGHGISPVTGAMLALVAFLLAVAIIAAFPSLPVPPPRRQRPTTGSALTAVRATIEKARAARSRW